MSWTSLQVLDLEKATTSGTPAALCLMLTSATPEARMLLPVSLETLMVLPSALEARMALPSALEARMSLPVTLHVLGRLAAPMQNAKYQP